jgi:RimJ/RimL family protein N-acetyltransferase
MEIVFKYIDEKNFPDVVGYITNKDVCKFLSWQPYSLGEDIKKYRIYAEVSRSYPDEIMAIYEKEEFLGTLHILKKESGICQFGFGILPEFWNRGLGTAISKKIIEYIKGSEWSTHFDILYSVIHDENKSAVNIAIKSGFLIDQNQSGVRESYTKYYKTI